MQFLIFYCVCASFVLVPVYSLTDNQKRILDDLELLCINKTKVILEDVEKLNGGDWTLESKQMREYILCLLMELDLITPGGVFRIEDALQRIPADDQAAAFESFKACYKLTGPDPAHTAWNYMKCYQTRHPKHSLLLTHTGNWGKVAAKTTNSPFNTNTEYNEADAWDWIGHQELHLSVHEEKALHDHQFSCINKTKVLSEDVKKLYDGNWETENPQVKTYVICLMNNLKFLSPEGEFLTTEALKRVPKEDQTAMLNIFEACNKTMESDAGNTFFANTQTTWTLLKCYHTKNPKYFLLSLLPYKYHNNKPSPENVTEIITTASTRKSGPWDWIGHEEEHLSILNGNTETPVDL